MARLEGVEGIVQGDRRADAQLAIGFFDALQVLHYPQADHARRILQLLVDPQPDIAVAGHQQRIGVFHPQRRQFGQADRGMPGLLRERRRPSGMRRQLQLAQRFDQRGFIEARQRFSGQGQGRIDNGPVAGATAQVTGQGAPDCGAIGVVPLLQQGKQRHDKTGGAETTLGSVMIDQRLLNRVQRSVALQSLDREQGLALQHRQQLDAGIDAAPAQTVCLPVLAAARIDLGHRHRAGAAIALGAAFLAAAQTPFLAQPLQQGLLGLEAGFEHRLAIEQELQRRRHDQLPR